MPRVHDVIADASADAEFIAGYVQAAQQFGLEYTPIVGGQPSLFQGGAAFPGNDWTVSTHGEEYLSRIPAQSHAALGQIRAFQLRVTQEVLKKLGQGNDKHDAREVTQFKCR